MNEKCFCPLLQNNPKLARIAFRRYGLQKMGDGVLKAYIEAHFL